MCTSAIQNTIAKTSKLTPGLGLLSRENQAGLVDPLDIIGMRTRQKMIDQKNRETAEYQAGRKKIDAANAAGYASLAAESRRT